MLQSLCLGSAGEWHRYAICDSPRSSVLTLSVAALLAVCSAFASSSKAVSLSGDGTGQVNLIPFYSVRNGHVTSLTVINQSRLHSKAIKVRFREALMGAAVLDLNVFLAPRDVWSASISDGGSGARFNTTDASCTSPVVPTDGVAFVNFYYAGQVAGTIDDGRGRTLDRTREGYVEIFEMGVVADGADAASSPATANGQAVAAALLQARNPATRNCSPVTSLNPFPQAGDLLAPASGVSSAAILIQVESGTEYVIPSMGLQRFFVPADRTSDLYTAPGSLKPDLASVSPARSDVPNPSAEGPAVLTVEDWVAAGGEAIDAVSAVLMKPALLASFDVSNSAFQSEIVQVLPTFNAYVRRNPVGSATLYSARAPFAPAVFTTDGVPASGSSCMMMQSEPSTRDGAGIANLAVQLGPRQKPAPNLPLNVCSAVVRVVPAIESLNPAPAPLLGSGPTASSLVLPAAMSGLNRFEQGWLALHAASRPALSPSEGPGILVQTVEDALLGMIVSGRSFPQEGGLGNLAPVHADGVARRYRGLPMLGFSVVRVLEGGQGYGGVFSAQGQPDPRP